MFHLPRHILHALLLVILLGAGCTESRQAAPVIELSTADTILLPYVEVTSGVWLDGDRWAVAAPEEQLVILANYASGQSQRLGASGAYGQPFALFTAGDSLFVADWGMRRVTVWTLAGKLVRFVGAPVAFRGALPRARDAAGNFYAELYPTPGPDGSGNRDSAVVLRGTADFSRVDTVARLAPLDLAEVVGNQGHRFERRALSGVDRWGVLPDGAVWVARVYHNRVDWIGPDGDFERGDPLPDRVLEVTVADRDLFIKGFPEELRSTAELLPFAIVKPPFEAGFTTPEGTVWLEKSHAVTDSTRSIQVVGRDGRLLRQVRYPGYGRLVAVGAAGVVTGEQYADGVRLLRFRMPEQGPPVANAPRK